MKPPTHKNGLGEPCSCPWFKPLVKEAAKIDWLIERQDKFSQTPEGQRALKFLQAQVARNPKLDPLTPWLYREAKKGRIQVGDRTLWILNDGVGGTTQITPPQLDHWADWFDSHSPTRRGVDIMQQSALQIADRIADWDEEMQQQMEESQAKEGAGQIVHRFDDGWTVRRLQNAQEASAEGDAMGHCVGSYGSAIENGSSQIFSLRDPNNAPHATMEISPVKHSHAWDYVIPEHVWKEVPSHMGVSIGRLAEMHGDDQLAGGDESTIYDNASQRTEQERQALADFRETYGHVPLEGGDVVQTQGKSNDTPLPAYTDKLDDWLHPHGLESWQPWWDDSYEMEGPQDIEQLVGDNGDDGLFGYWGAAEALQINEPDEYRRAEYEAHERGVEPPALYITKPNYHAILQSLIDPPVSYVGKPDDPWTTGRPWSGYSPEAGDYVLQHAARKHPIVTAYGRPLENEPASNHLEDLHTALRDHMQVEYEPWPGHEQDFMHITDPRDRQKAMEAAERQWYDENGYAQDPWHQMFNHLGPQLDPSFKVLDPRAYRSQIHPEQDRLWDQKGIPYNFDWESLPSSYQLQFDGPPQGVFAKMAALYKRWVFSPATGQVTLADNNGDPLDVRYHSDLARELNEPNLVHGYAYPIGGGWRLMDWESKPLLDPYIIAQVMGQLRSSQPASRAQDSSWSPIQEAPQWDRIHHGSPS